MRTGRGFFWHSLLLTLLLLLPVMAVTLFLVGQRERQIELRQAGAARGGVAVEPGAQSVHRLLLVVQSEEPSFLLARLDAPAATVTLAALPGELAVQAPSGTTTLADCTLAAGPGRVVQLLCGTIATGETAPTPPQYLCATAATWTACAGADTTVRFDTSSLLGPAAREALGYGEDPVAEVTADEAETLITALQGHLATPSARANARAAVWAAFARQNPAMLETFPEALRDNSARTLTSLLAQDIAGLEDTLHYLTGQRGLTVDYRTLGTQTTDAGVTLTAQAMEEVREILN